MANVKQIADHLQVSSATVSRVLNSRPGIAQATRKRVLDAAAELGVDRSVGLKSSRYIAFIHPLGQFLGNIGEFHAALFGGIGRALGQQQYDMALLDPYRDKRPDESYTQYFYRKDVQGVIIQVRPNNQHVVNAIADEGFPMIQVSGTSDHPRASWIVVDSASAYEQAVEHLYHLGHRRIAMCERDIPDHDHLERIEGFERGCRRLGLSLEPGLRFRVPSNPRGGGNVIRRILTLPEPPTAVVFASGRPTRGAMRMCVELGIRVPEDLSIIGFDDADRRFETMPAYTAVSQDAESLGDQAANALTTLLANPRQDPIRTTLPANFEVLESTAPPPAPPAPLPATPSS
ncbi:MAG: LacI family DNA-binding transcriptional regulator [Planctomycetota bacterium]